MWQAEDRVYRIGQTQEVNVQWLRGFPVCTLVDEMLQRKQVAASLDSNPQHPSARAAQ